MQTPAPIFAQRSLRRYWRGLLSFALVAMLAFQSFGLVHKLDAVHHPAESMCEFCAHTGLGDAPLAQPHTNHPPVAQKPRLVTAVTVATPVFRLQPPPARGPPAHNA